MNTKALRQKILDLAIHGKLLPLEKVEQIRKDEPASILLEKIRAEKQEKIAKGKLKKDKNDSFIFVGDDKRHYEKFANGSVKDIEDEIPFEVPEGWSWCRLPSICRKPITDGTHNSPTTTDKGDFLYITAKNIKFNKIDLSNVSYVSKEIHDEIYKRCPPELNDILLTKDGTIGEVAINNLVEPFSLLSSVALIKPITNILPCFIAYVLMSNYMQSSMKHSAKGVALKRIILEQINTFLIPLPPLTEQKLIVEEIEKIFVQIDLLEQNKTDLQTAIKQAKSKILDLAIHGKLVPQDPNDEPASVLLEKIRAEKEEKIAKGELKRDKNDSFIYKSTTDNCHYEKLNGKDVCIEDELPFTIPENWQWCRLGDICFFQNGYAFQSNKFDKNGKTKVIRISDINDGYVEERKCILSLEEITDDSFLVKKGDLLIAMSGATTGKNGIYNSDTIAYINQRVGNIKIKNINTFYPKFRNFYIKSMEAEILKQAYGGAQPNISGGKICEMLLPLPPLSEQKRIVAKIEELFSLLDQIQTNIV